MPGKVITRVWALLSEICPKVSLFFASSFKVSVQNARNDDSQGLGPIVCYLSQSFTVFLLVVLSLAFGMLRMVIPRVWALLSAICPQVSLFLPLILRLAFRMLRMVIPRVSDLLCASCLKISLLFACSFEVDFQIATDFDTQSLGPIVCYLFQCFALFYWQF